MAERTQGGKASAIDAGTVERVSGGLAARLGQKLRDTLDVWFGPGTPQAPSAPAGTAPRVFDYPSQTN
ncbi:MAG TPA: hypothetical protein VEW69_10225, partial [Alphaproteobacteria bacterium]|nr:hypothetical protein [Alphaproteobacteria bacterium]